MTEVFVNFNLGRLAFVAFGAVAKFILVIFVVESYGAFFVVIGVAVSSDSNGGTYECENHHHDYKFLHFLPPWFAFNYAGRYCLKSCEQFISEALLENIRHRAECR